MVRRILVPLDGSPTAERGLAEAIRVARTNGSRLVLLHVIDDFPTMREFASVETLEIVEGRRRQAAELMLSAAAKMAKHAGVAAEHCVLRTRDTAAQTIIDKAHELHCDLIVLGTHGRGGVARAIIGSVAEGVARHSNVPALLVPPTASV
jgi:nucleotide-binding universal stress UspA family protein